MPLEGGTNANLDMTITDICVKWAGLSHRGWFRDHGGGGNEISMGSSEIIQVNYAKCEIK